MAIALKHWETYRVEPDSSVRLQGFATDAHDFCDEKKQGREEMRRYLRTINDLAAPLAAENKRSLLVVFQGMDASGKDGVVKKVFTGVNPQHCKVTSFKPPDREEREHDFLWRVVRAMPAKGEIGVFNRSQYEDVVARQARGDIPRSVGFARLRQIADLERAWVENAIVVRKFFLHISRAEQGRRFQSRLDVPDKRWKVDPSDFEDRRRWPAFQHVYEDVLSRTSTPHAPWYIIPADHKWYRDLAVAGIVLATLGSMRPRIPQPKLDLSRLKI